MTKLTQRERGYIRGRRENRRGKRKVEVEEIQTAFRLAKPGEPSENGCVRYKIAFLRLMDRLCDGGTYGGRWFKVFDDDYEDMEDYEGKFKVNKHYKWDVCRCHACRSEASDDPERKVAEQEFAEQYRQADQSVPFLMLGQYDQSEMIKRNSCLDRRDLPDSVIEKLQTCGRAEYDGTKLLLLFDHHGRGSDRCVCFDEIDYDFDLELSEMCETTRKDCDIQVQQGIHQDISLIMYGYETSPHDITAQIPLMNCKLVSTPQVFRNILRYCKNAGTEEAVKQIDKHGKDVDARKFSRRLLSSYENAIINFEEGAKKDAEEDAKEEEEEEDESSEDDDTDSDEDDSEASSHDCQNNRNDVDRAIEGLSLK